VRGVRGEREEEGKADLSWYDVRNLERIKRERQEFKPKHEKPWVINTS
jgi:hypothetical protein